MGAPAPVRLAKSSAFRAAPPSCKLRVCSSCWHRAGIRRNLEPIDSAAVCYLDHRPAGAGFTKRTKKARCWDGMHLRHGEPLGGIGGQQPFQQVLALLRRVLRSNNTRKASGMRHTMTRFQTSWLLLSCAQTSFLLAVDGLTDEGCLRPGGSAPNCTPSPGREQWQLHAATPISPWGVQSRP